MEPGTVDFSKHYSVSCYPGVAFRVLRYVEIPEGDWELICDDENCLHDLDTCCVYNTWTTIDYEWVIAVITGDNHQFMIEVSELSEIGDDDYCPSCGQIGCDW